MLSKITNETKAADNEVEDMCNVTAKFLDPEENGQRNRPKREAPVAAAVAVDGIALFRSLGVSRQVLKDAELLDYWENGKITDAKMLKNYGRKNYGRNIARLNDCASVLTDYILEFESESNEKFFPVSNEIAGLVYEIATVEQGLLSTLAILFASRQTSFHVYSTHVIPMPQLDP